MAQSLESDFFEEIAFREIGPTSFGGRIVDIELIPDEPFSILVASASGGLFKSENNGTTWQNIFQNEATISIGDIAVASDDGKVIYVGTGEANNQRSSYWGDGVYKTTDGGETWTNTGLRDSHHIGRIIVDPNDANTVYVAALGHLYSFNEERGLFKTTDGGESWDKVLYIDEKSGIVDVVIDPSDSNVLYAASYERLRRPWHFSGAGDGSDIYKSTDAGETWTKLESGLPDGNLGRIGLTIFPDDPDILYATVSNQNSATANDVAQVNIGFEGRPIEGGYLVEAIEENSNAAGAGLRVGDLITSINETDVDTVWMLMKALNELDAGEEVEIIFSRGDEIFSITFELQAGDADERDVHGIPVRQIGGEIYRTNDSGETWIKTNERPVGGTPPYYYGQIRVDPNDSQRIYVLSVPLLASSDGGKTWDGGNIAGSVHVDHHALVIDPHNSDRLLLGNDGGLAISTDRGETWMHYDNIPMSQFYAVGIDMQQPYHIYGGTQDNGTWGGPSNTRSSRGIANKDWYRVGGGDGFYAQVDPTNSDIVYGESQFGVIYRLDKSTWQSTSIRPQQTDRNNPDRYNWNSPILISHHNPSIIYFGGNKLFKSFDRGDTWPIISPDLTTANADKIQGNVPHCTITTIAESAIDPSMLMVGTDDGLVQLSEDGGLTWTNLAGRFPGVPTDWWVSRVVLSRHERARGYVTFTGYREDDFRTLIYKTENAGQNWQRIDRDLSGEPVNVIAEDPHNANVLYLGTEFGVYVSIDQGEHWTELTTGLPTIPVHDLVVHPRDHDLVLATHGRGFFVADVSPFAELNKEILSKQAHLFPVEDGYQWLRVNNSAESGDGHFFGPNEDRGIAIWYYLGKTIDDDDVVQLRIENEAGDVVSEMELSKDQLGLQSALWNLRDESNADESANDNRRRRHGRQALPDTYTAVLKVNDKEMRQKFEVLYDPFVDD